jgi:hypothetical protein
MSLIYVEVQGSLLGNDGHGPERGGRDHQEHSQGYAHKRPLHLITQAHLRHRCCSRTAKVTIPYTHHRLLRHVLSSQYSRLHSPSSSRSCTQLTIFASAWMGADDDVEVTKSLHRKRFFKQDHSTSRPILGIDEHAHGTHLLVLLERKIDKTCHVWSITVTVTAFLISCRRKVRRSKRSRPEAMIQFG